MLTVNSFKIIRAFSLFAIIFLYQVMQSCEIESEPSVKEFINVDERLWTYFEEFEAQAAQRGYAIDLNQRNLTGEIAAIHDGDVIGTCSYGFRRPNAVTIDNNFWNRNGLLGREEVVFHELGHCVLGRDHTERVVNSGFCASIMRSGTGSCRSAYNVANRDFYLDELFQESRP